MGYGFVNRDQKTERWRNRQYN